MKKSFLFLATLALVSVAACQKIETPETQETPEVVAPEEPAVAEKPETALNAEEVAYILNDVAEKEEVKLFIKKMIFMVREGNDSRHFEFSVGPQSEDNPDLTYISGALGLVRGEFHPIVVDMDLMVVSQIPIVGQLDPAQISKNYIKAGLALDDITCEYYLYQASKGLDIAVANTYRLAFLRGEDEKGHRTMDLYVINPNDPDFPPFPIGNVLKSFINQ